MGGPFFTPEKLGKIAAESSDPRLRLRAVKHLKKRLEILHMADEYYYIRDKPSRFPNFHPVKAIKLKILRNKIESLIKRYNLNSFNNILSIETAYAPHLFFKPFSEVVAADYIIALKKVIYEGKHIDSKKEALDYFYRNYRENLIEIATEHQDRDTRHAVIAYLAKGGGVLRQKCLINIINASTFEDTREYAIESLIDKADMEDQKNLDFFRETCIDDKNPKIRGRALSSILGAYEKVLDSKASYLQELTVHAKDADCLKICIGGAFNFIFDEEKSLLHQFGKICRHSEDKETIERIVNFIADNSPRALLEGMIYCVPYRSSEKTSELFLSSVYRKITELMTEECPPYYNKLRGIIHNNISEEVKQSMSEEDVDESMQFFFNHFKAGIKLRFPVILAEIASRSHYPETVELCKNISKFLKDDSSK